MKRPTTLAHLSLLLSLGLTGCSHIPGKPVSGDEVPRPASNLDFASLYQQNCAGCHGAEGQQGAAINLANPEYQALVDNATLRTAIAQGVKGTLMPAFARSSGGMLTDPQVDALVQGMRARWARPVEFSGTALPTYKADGAGDPVHGAQVYAAACASCHGAADGDAHGKTDKAGPITNTVYLSLVSNQALRTVVIVGRPDFEAPDWRGDMPGHALSNQEITDVVAWLASLRPAPPQTQTTTQPTMPQTTQPTQTQSISGPSRPVLSGTKLQDGVPQ
jgi:cytochrome c oxidase cbb3-type subunit 3/ubiquinol-cytochrome c reductase cytochrome c subunit